MINNNPPNPRDNFCRDPIIRLPPFFQHDQNVTVSSTLYASAVSWVNEKLKFFNEVSRRDRCLFFHVLSKKKARGEIP
jgi:hypothetical protein